MGITHTKVSTVSDEASTVNVRPSDWNADHAFSSNVALGGSTLSGGVLSSVAINASTYTGTIGASTLSGVLTNGSTIQGGNTRASSVLDATITTANITASTYAGNINASTLNGVLTNASSISGGGISSANITASTFTGNIAAGSTHTASQFKGTSTLPIAQLTSSALLATPVAGALEYDGPNYYLSDNLARRHLNNTEMYCVLHTSYVLTDSTVIQKLFNASTNGAVNVGPNQTYFFETCFTLAGLTTASVIGPGFGFAGNAAVSSVHMYALSVRTGTTGTGAVTGAWFNTTASTNNLFSNAGSTTPNIVANVRGRLVIGTSGTLIPSLSIVTTSASLTPSVERGSYFRIWPVGHSTVDFVGAWT